MGRDTLPTLLATDEELKGFYDYLMLRHMRPVSVRTHLLRIKTVKHIIGRPLLSLRSKPDLEPVIRWMNERLEGSNGNKRHSHAWFNGFVSSIREFFITYWEYLYDPSGSREPRFPPFVALKGEALLQSLPSTPKDKVMQFSHREVFFRVLANWSEPWKTFFTLTYDVGLRLGETIHATMSNMDRDLRVYRVRAPIYHGRTIDNYELKHSRSRSVDRNPPISKITLDLIDNWLKERPQTPKDHPEYAQLIFLDNRQTYEQFGKQTVPIKRYGMPLYKELAEREFRKVMDACRLYCSENNIKLNWDGITPHVLRASYATHSFYHGVDPVVLAKYLGHKDLQPLMTYIRISGEWSQLKSKVRVPSGLEIQPE